MLVDIQAMLVNIFALFDNKAGFWLVCGAIYLIILALVTQNLFICAVFSVNISIFSPFKIEETYYKAIYTPLQNIVQRV